MKASLMQQSWESVRDHFKRGGDSRELLYLVLALLALIVLLVVVHHTLGRASERTPANNPQKLFRSVLAKLNLGVKERDLLRRVARDRRVEHPITLVLSPDVFRGHVEPWLADQAREGIAESPGRAKEADTLCHSLFDQSLH